MSDSCKWPRPLHMYPVSHWVVNSVSANHARHRRATDDPRFRRVSGATLETPSFPVSERGGQSSPDWWELVLRQTSCQKADATIASPGLDGRARRAEPPTQAN